MAFLSNRIFQTSIIVGILIIIFVPPLSKGVLESAPFQQADAVGEAYVDEAFNRALIAFALARATNAVISVVQDSEIDITPAGVGVTIAAGEVLDPINDMIERFSVVMLVSLVSLGIQKFLITIVPWFSFKLILAPALLLFIPRLWTKKPWAFNTTYIARRLLVLALLLRFSVPAIAVLNEKVYQLFLDQQYVEAIDGLEQGKQTLTEFSPLSNRAELTAETGIMASLKGTARQLQEATNLRLQIERLSDRLGFVVKDLLAMIVIFLLNTILFPLAFLWILYKLLGRLCTGLTLLQPALIAASPTLQARVNLSEGSKPQESEPVNN